MSSLLSPMKIATLLCLSLSTSGAAWAQAYVDQVNRNGGNKAYVEQMPAGAKPGIAKPNSQAKRNTSASSTRSGKTAGQTAAAGKSSTVQGTGNDIVPTVGTGSSAIVRLVSSEMDWPSVGRGTVSR